MTQSIGIIGTGYVGLVTGACLADVGNSVLCIDVNEEKLERLRQGQSVIYEQGLDRLLERNIREDRLTFSSDIRKAVQECPILMLCLPTPPGKDGSADLAAVMTVAEQVAKLIVDLNIVERRIIVNKSTVPVGTAAKVATILELHAPGRNVCVVSNPEFLSEGYAIDEFMKPERVIIGTDDEDAKQVMIDLYLPFTRTGAPMYCFDLASAEIAKYAANAFLATKISFMNDLSEYCEAVGANIDKVRLGMGADNRIGRRFLFAGVGYGGSCFPKDVKAIAHSARSVGVTLEVVEAAQQANEHQVERFVKQVISRFNGDIHGKQFAVWGLAFKPQTDDVRDAPALTIIRMLLEKGARVSAYDPEALGTTRHVLGDSIVYASNMNDALNDADALIITTEWNEFRNPDFSKIIGAMRYPLVFDGRNLFQVEDMQGKGLEYHSIGRPSVYPDDVVASQ